MWSNLKPILHFYVCPPYKKSRNTVDKSTGITMEVVVCLLCHAESLRKHFVARHWAKHKGEVFNGKPCEEYTFRKVKNRLQLDKVCSTTRSTNPATIKNQRLDSLMKLHVKEESKLNQMLWTIEGKLLMNKPVTLHFFVSTRVLPDLL